jgi:hypothetical protein
MFGGLVEHGCHLGIRTFTPKTPGGALVPRSPGSSGRGGRLPAALNRGDGTVSAVAKTGRLHRRSAILLGDPGRLSDVDHLMPDVNK